MLVVFRLSLQVQSFFSCTILYGYGQARLLCPSAMPQLEQRWVNMQFALYRQPPGALFNRLPVPTHLACCGAGLPYVVFFPSPGAFVSGGSLGSCGDMER